MTKGRRVSLARRIIDGEKLGAEFSAAATYELNAILGTRFESFARAINPLFPGDNRYLHRLDDGTWAPFSWNNCVRTVPPRAEQIRKLAEERKIPMTELLRELVVKELVK